MWTDTAATRLLNIKFPIVQGPFGGRFSSVKLVTAVSSRGGMGSFGLNSYSAEEIQDINKEIVSQTSGTYALNLWVPLEKDPVDKFTQDEFEEVVDQFEPHFRKVGVDVPREMNKTTQNFELQVEAILKAKPPVASFIFGIPSSDILAEFKRQQIITMAVATTTEEAMLIQEAGMDIVIASGAEAGGHRASFLDTAENSLESTVSLVPKVRKNVTIPVIAAGGITTGADVVKMLRNGADAVQMGTVFLATQESNVPNEHREVLFSSQYHTKLTKVFSGRLARVVTSDFVESMDKEKVHAPYPVQSSMLGPLRAAAKEQGLQDYEAYWAGQPTTDLKHRTVASLLDSIIQDVEQEMT